jgi:DNA-binding HxlR family transcriptional regulator
MYDYGEYCPIGKAAQVLGERWTLLIIREMLCGVTRFNEFRRYLPRISPSLLNARLHALEQQGLIFKRRRSEMQGYEYCLTDAGRQLEPIIMALGNWASRWVYAEMSEHELNTDVLMRDIQQTLVTANLPAARTVIRFHLTDAESMNKWYLVAENGRSELCDEDRALDVDVYVTADKRTLVEVWLGDIEIARACSDGRLKLSGAPALVKNFPHWFSRSPFIQARIESLKQRAL